ncbi:Glycosylphosphatidylinositol-mannosyltransferase I, PIG-X/PBN1 [Phytophthora cactorum]|nr:Glycosylphosphatidylinositol-mannosyltransferase I, PIG-X/PBN1 [Phytophthora cactorum]
MRRWAGIFAVSGWVSRQPPSRCGRNGASVVESSHGGALGTFHMKIDTQSESSTFDHFLASSSRFDGMSAVGIHLQARLREEADWSAINETRHERIENNVRGVLQNTVPSFEILPSLSKGFLAKSFCDFRAWKTSNPLEEILRKPAAGSSSIATRPPFLSRQRARQPFQKGKHEPRLALMKFSRSSTSATIEAEYLETWIARPSSSDGSFRAALPIGKTRLAPARWQASCACISSICPRDPRPKDYRSGLAASSYRWEGFHRRYAMDVEILESERMERFGELKLLSFTKHIEIERPSPVSSQHVVGLEFIMPSNNQAHFEFPIHFRYQAPSESELYRQAPVIAPDIFLFCRDGDNSAREKRNPSDDDAAFITLRRGACLIEEFRAVAATGFA